MVLRPAAYAYGWSPVWRVGGDHGASASVGVSVAAGAARGTVCIWHPGTSDCLWWDRFPLRIDDCAWFSGAGRDVCMHGALCAEIRVRREPDRQSVDAALCWPL